MGKMDWVIIPAPAPAPAPVSPTNNTPDFSPPNVATESEKKTFTCLNNECEYTVQSDNRKNNLLYMHHNREHSDAKPPRQSLLSAAKATFLKNHVKPEFNLQDFIGCPENGCNYITQDPDKLENVRKKNSMQDHRKNAHHISSPLPPLKELQQASANVLKKLDWVIWG
ncbi:hypothetical protein [Endozoicomonas sp.]|uniref:hypothetical protein n=1 Tax=Endozoicomonas sp. TaxID=1892382 RepID=UPI002888CB51|nr:hypothetical protein [Endozoicomonas sp.]